MAYYNFGDTDFIGFTFGETHYPDETNGFICHVSDGSRYNDLLTPNFQDRTTQVQGSNQTYYFGSDFTDRTIDFEIAFDGLTEAQFRKMKQVFSTQDLKPLIIDEAPYKKYYVKCASAPQLKYLCFEEDGQRVYKGEGTINFVAYYPYGIGLKNFYSELNNKQLFYNSLTYYKTISNSSTRAESGINYYFKEEKNSNDTEVEYEISLINTNNGYFPAPKAPGESYAVYIRNTNDWYGGINWPITNEKAYAIDNSKIYYNDPCDNGNGQKFYLYNDGDLETDLYIILTPLENSTIISPCELWLDENNKFIIQKEIDLSTEQSSRIIIDPKLELVLGQFDSSIGPQNGTIPYNNYTSGNFLKLPKSSNEQILYCNNKANNISVQYTYLYY